MNKRIKVLYTIPNFDTAGSGKVVYDLVKGLDKSKFEVELACEHNRGTFFKEVEALGMPIHIIKTTTEYRPYGSLYSRLKPIVGFFKTNKYDVIHSWHWSSDWTEVLAAKFAGVKWLYTKKAMSWGNRHWKARSYLSDFIITINNEMKDYFPNKKSQKLVPLGIDTEYYKPKGLVNKSVDTFNIVTVANLVPVKGIEVLLKAIQLLNDKNIRLTVAGNNENEYSQGLVELCKELKINDQVEFLGKIADVRTDIEESDVYIIPTLNAGRKEGMPMALVEAMCMSVPVIGSNISGIKYVLKDFSELLFEASNFEELAVLIKKMKVMNANERAKLGQELRNYCLEHFTMKLFIDEHEKLYNQIINK